MSIRFYRCKRRTILSALLAILMIVCVACTTSAMPEQNQESQPGLQEDMPIIQLKTLKQAAPSEAVQIACVASTKNDEVLNYEWSATRGQIQEKGDRATWTAPNAVGNYTITVVASSYDGRKATSSVTILVTPNPNRPPVIHSVTCLGCKNGTQAAVWKTYSIQCDASDPEGDDLDYEWSATVGKIEGNGHFATWQTLGEYAYSVIIVKVKDSEGNESEGYLAVNVACCD